MPHPLTLGTAAAALLICLAAIGAHGANPVEVGTVEWRRDLDPALAESRASGKPVFLLFQEVPGCAGCQAFGQTVLTNPLLVEAIESEFLPVLVHNNKDGDDKKILERFKEPAWNYQVVRFLDGDAKDLIPRKDKVWTIGALATRMNETLAAANRPIPKYLEALAAEHDTTHHATTAFAQYCFWTGEMELGGLDGVITTEAGWLEGREVTRVVYDARKMSLDALTQHAKNAKCADKVYANATAPGATYKAAKASDQKKQLTSWPAARDLPGITPMQLTKINALAPKDPAAALEWLSPRQRAALRATGRHSSR
jgi:hypothetical protein